MAFDYFVDSTECVSVAAKVYALTWIWLCYIRKKNLSLGSTCENNLKFALDVRSSLLSALKAGHGADPLDCWLGEGKVRAEVDDPHQHAVEDGVTLVQAKASAGGGGQK